MRWDKPWWSATAEWGDEHFGVVVTERGLHALILPHEWHDPNHPGHRGPNDPVRLAPYLRELDEYWRGIRHHWSVPLDWEGTPFQLMVWTQLLAIPYGTVTTYGDVARQIGRPHAVRAVAAAVGRNPLPLVVPCHRVVGANHTLTGYRGGLALKERLLALEGVRGLNPAGHRRFQF